MTLRLNRQEEVHAEYLGAAACHQRWRAEDVIKGERGHDVAEYSKLTQHRPKFCDQRWWVHCLAGSTALGINPSAVDSRTPDNTPHMMLAELLGINSVTRHAS